MGCVMYPYAYGALSHLPRPGTIHQHINSFPFGCSLHSESHIFAWAYSSFVLSSLTFMLALSRRQGQNLCDLSEGATTITLPPTHVNYGCR